MERIARMAVAAAAGWLTLSQASTAAESSDEWVTTKTAIALFAIPEVDPGGISVESRDGHVTLVGAVPNAAAKDRVVSVVRQVEGVKDIRDELQVSAPPVVEHARPRSSEDLRTEVVETLKDDADLTDNAISVEVENGGVIELGGFARSLSDQLRALRLTRGVPGVEMVRNAMKSPPDTLHDPVPAAGAARGADVRNRRERQARDGRAEEPIPVPAGDAPPADPPEHPAGINPGGDTTEAPHSGTD
jgi:osmotically-inducible protein OsmY